MIRECLKKLLLWSDPDQHINEYGLILLRHFEGISLKAYQDEGGVWTIGIGHTGGVLPTDIITREQAEFLFQTTISLVEREVKRLVKVHLNSNQFSALCCFDYNIGCTEFASSHLLKYLNAQRMDLVSVEWPKWNHIKKDVSLNLTERRDAELKLFLRPIHPGLN